MCLHMYTNKSTFSDDVLSPINTSPQKRFCINVKNISVPHKADNNELLTSLHDTDTKELKGKFAQ